MGKVVNKLKSLVNNKQIKEYINMEKKIFTEKETTREQYLKFKEFIKSETYKDHSDYIHRCHCWFKCNGKLYT